LSSEYYVDQTTFLTEHKLDLVVKLVPAWFEKHQGELHLDVAKVRKALPLNYMELVSDQLLPYRPDNRMAELKGKEIHGEHFDYCGQVDR